MKPLNQSEQPSRLLLDRYATDELSQRQREDVERALLKWPDCQQYLDGLETVRAEIMRLDVSEWAAGLRSPESPQSMSIAAPGCAGESSR